MLSFTFTLFYFQYLILQFYFVEWSLGSIELVIPNVLFCFENILVPFLGWNQYTFSVFYFLINCQHRLSSHFVGAHHDSASESSCSRLLGHSKSTCVGFCRFRLNIMPCRSGSDGCIL